MSNADTRAEIAAAVSTVTGLNGFVQRPVSPNAGDAWPLWRGGERSDGSVFVNTWAVLLVLPSSETTADEWADLYGVQLADALESVMFVDAIAPATISAGSAGELLALMITGRSE